MLVAHVLHLELLQCLQQDLASDFIQIGETEGIHAFKAEKGWDLFVSYWTLGLSYTSARRFCPQTLKPNQLHCQVLSCYDNDSTSLETSFGLVVRDLGLSVLHANIGPGPGTPMFMGFRTTPLYTTPSSSPLNYS